MIMITFKQKMNIVARKSLTEALCSFVIATVLCSIVMTQVFSYDLMGVILFDVIFGILYCVAYGAIVALKVVLIDCFDGDDWYYYNA